MAATRDNWDESLLPNRSSVLPNVLTTVHLLMRLSLARFCSTVEETTLRVLRVYTV